MAGTAADQAGTINMASETRDRGMTTAPLIGIERAMLNTRIVSWALGMFAAVSFIVCVIYGLITPESLHMHAFLEQVLPAFKWLTWYGFILGLFESFLYGAYAGLVFCPIYNWLDRKWGTAQW